MARTRKPRTPIPVALTPEQIEAQARREARNDAYVAAREALINKARGLAELLHPGRVHAYPRDEGFTIMFGDPTSTHLTGYRGPGNLELRVDLSTWARIEGTDEFSAPTLRISPRSYSLGSDVTLDHCEALGRSMIEAAHFGRTLLALTSTPA
jgi:hypothetical protein